MSLILRLGAALLGGALAFTGTVEPIATPDASVAATNGRPTQVAFAYPLTASSSETGLLSAETLEQYTSITGELSRGLNAVINRPVAIGVDPMIVASIRLLGSTAPASAVAWLDRLAASTNEKFALAYADADVAALSQAGATTVLGPIFFNIDPTLFPNGVPTAAVDDSTPEDQGSEGDGVPESPSPAPSPQTVSPSPSPSPSAPVSPTLESLLDLPYTLESIVWPRENSVVAADLPVFSGEAGATTILGSGNVSYDRDAVPASATVGDNRVLVSNTDISLLLRAAASAINQDAWEQAMAELTLALAGWTGGDSTVLATFDRGAPGGLNRIGQTIDAVQALADSTVTTLAATLAENPVAVAVIDRPVDVQRTDRLTVMLATEPGIAAFATILDEPGLLTGERRLALLALASNSWTALPTPWLKSTTAYLARVSEIVAAVRVEESSTLNLRSFTGDLPFTVSNSLPYPVTVFVTVSTNTAILDVREDLVPVVVEPESQNRALIPVQSIANGDVGLQVSLSSVTGVPISTPVYATANVQAEWETAFTVTVAIIVLLVFIFGIIRTIRRRRRERTARQAAGRQADASAPAGDVE